MNKELDALATTFYTQLNEIQNETALKELEQEYLGKKGKLKTILA